MTIGTVGKLHGGQPEELMVLRQIDFETTVHSHFPFQMNAGLAFPSQWIWSGGTNHSGYLEALFGWIYIQEPCTHPFFFWKWQENKGLLRKGSRDRAKTIYFVYLSKGYSNTTFSLCLAVQQDWIHLTDSDICWSELRKCNNINGKFIVSVMG